MMKATFHLLVIMCAAALAAPATVLAQDEDDAWLAGDKEHRWSGPNAAAAKRPGFAVLVSMSSTAFFVGSVTSPCRPTPGYSDCLIGRPSKS